MKTLGLVAMFFVFSSTAQAQECAYQAAYHKGASIFVLNPGLPIFGSNGLISELIPLVLNETAEDSYATGICRTCGFGTQGSAAKFSPRYMDGPVARTSAQGEITSLEMSYLTENILESLTCTK